MHARYYYRRIPYARRVDEEADIDTVSATQLNRKHVAAECSLLAAISNAPAHDTAAADFPSLSHLLASPLRVLPEVSSAMTPITRSAEILAASRRA